MRPWDGMARVDKNGALVAVVIDKGIGANVVFVNDFEKEVGIIARDETSHMSYSHISRLQVSRFLWMSQRKSRWCANDAKSDPSLHRTCT